MKCAAGAAGDGSPSRERSIVAVSLPFRPHGLPHRIRHGDKGTTAWTRKKRFEADASVTLRVVVEPGSGETTPRVTLVAQALLVRLVRSST